MFITTQVGLRLGRMMVLLVKIGLLEKWGRTYKGQDPDDHYQNKTPVILFPMSISY